MPPKLWMNERDKYRKALLSLSRTEPKLQAGNTNDLTAPMGSENSGRFIQNPFSVRSLISTIREMSG